MIEVTPLDFMGSDLTVVNAARVSFGKASSWEGNGCHLKPSDKRLIGYLAEHGHTSPFGHCFASFHVKAPIFVARQLVKHKFLRWNEISRRYVDDEPEFYVPDVWRGRAKDKKQGSGGVVDVGKLEDPSCGMAEQVLWYEHLLKKGVAPEMARMVLPVQYTQNGTGRALLMPLLICAAFASRKILSMSPVSSQRGSQRPCRRSSLLVGLPL